MLLHTNEILIILLHVNHARHWNSLWPCMADWVTLQEAHLDLVLPLSDAPQLWFLQVILSVDIYSIHSVSKWTELDQINLSLSCYPSRQKWWCQSQYCHAAWKHNTWTCPNLWCSWYANFVSLNDTITPSNALTGNITAYYSVPRPPPRGLNRGTILEKSLIMLLNNTGILQVLIMPYITIPIWLRIVYLYWILKVHWFNLLVFYSHHVL